MKIKVAKNGPLLVSGNVPLGREDTMPNEEGTPIKWENKDKITHEKTYALCRCGKSKIKPFCDGAHDKTGFDGTETAGHQKFDDRAEVFDGPELILKDAESFCAIARFCDLGERAWGYVNNSNESESKKMAIEECCNCPSGRLVVIDKKTGKEIEPKLDKAISVTEDVAAELSGPLWVKGGIPVESADGKEYEVRNRVTLCRCGKSENKPFCDGSHLNTGFIDESVHT